MCSLELKNCPRIIAYAKVSAYDYLFHSFWHFCLYDLFFTITRAFYCANNIVFISFSDNLLSQLVFRMFCVNFFHNLKSISFGKTSGYHCLFKINKSSLFFVLKILESPNKTFLILFKFLCFFFIFIN